MRTPASRPRRRAAATWLSLIGGLLAVAPAASAATSTLRLRVEAARTNATPYSAPTVTRGDPVTTYRWLITRDDAGDPTQPASGACFPVTPADYATYPANCTWPSIHAVTGGSAAQTLTQGSNVDLNGTTGLSLPNGSYLISVTADGFKIDGAHFTVPLADPGLVTVGLQPFPLPLATIRIQVFEDTATNGQFDVPGELGLRYFEGHIDDVLGETTTDWFGNALCTRYQLDGAGPNYLLDVDGKPIRIDGTGGKCLSDANGVITIPNMGSNRYAVTVTPPTGKNAEAYPAGTQWVQTSTLEGGHDWDTWPQENSTGYDTELVNGNEPVPEVPIGFVRVHNDYAGGTATGAIKGTVENTRAYTPPASGLQFGGEAGTKIVGPLPRPWIALDDLGLNDNAQRVVFRGNADGTFLIPHVANGDYSMAIWDGPQDFIIEVKAVSVRNGAVTDIGVQYMSHWFSRVFGSVFIDANENGKRDPGEVGVPNLATALKSRDNSVQDQGVATFTTDLAGNYDLSEAYPLGQWVVAEVYDDRYYTTGVTFQADNQPTATTVLGAGVDVSTFNLVGLETRLDWGVKAYAPATNGGIVGTVTYDSTRNETNARLEATEDYQGGISGLTVDLYAPVTCMPAPGDATCVQGEDHAYYRVVASGAYALGAHLDSYTTETWDRPIGCTPRDVNGNPQIFPFVPNPIVGAPCLEGFAYGNQAQTGFSTVNGNYGFGDIADGVYIIKVQIPNDPLLGRPLYKVTREEDINVFSGDVYQPQEPDPPCVGALHTVDVAGIAPDGPNATANPDFAGVGGSPYEGQQMPLCDAKLINLKDQRSIAPNFYLFTDVPVPGRFYGIVTDDLTLSANPRELFYGEKIGVPNIPLGLYDFSGRNVFTTQTDRNGSFEMLVPSVSSYNCPLPAGPCPNVYRFVANDPGQPTRPNANFNPQYRVLATNFQAWPNITLPADLAPVTIAVAVEGPGTQLTHPAACLLPSDPAIPTTLTPQLYAVDRPWVPAAGNAAARTVTINGSGFGTAKGNVSVDGVNRPAATVTWSPSQITVEMPTAPGPHQVEVLSASGQSTVNGITIHVVGSGYNPARFEVGPGHTYATVQAGIQAATPTAGALVLVYPGTPTAFNPEGHYDENVVIHSRLKLQGVGPGGIIPNLPAYGARAGVQVLGSVIDGSGFNTGVNPVTGVTQAQAWRALVGGLQRAGNQAVFEAATVTVYPQTTGQFTGGNGRAMIDGLTIQGGNQLGFPGNLNDNGGGPVPTPTPVPGEVAVIQGGGLFVNGYARFLQVSNDIFKANGGSYGGAIRLGTANVPGAAGNSNNDNVTIADNQIIQNGGTNLAGAIAIFRGTNNYEVARNDICGNFSAEYGGGISHFGRSPGGRIHHNRIYYNGSYDEGAGIMIAGEQPVPPATLSSGAGAAGDSNPIRIDHNIIQSNISNDDGGGIRLLMVGDSAVRIDTNFIVNNVSAHEGGGIALDDAPRVRLVANTIMKNITTATSLTSNGAPAPAGLAAAANSAALQATLGTGAPTYSKPVQFDNIFWDNRAGNWTGSVIAGIGATGDPGPINQWDLGTTGVAASLPLAQQLNPLYSIVQQNPVQHRYVVSGTNKTTNPNVINPYDTRIAALPWRGDPNFISAVTIALDVDPTLMGEYHLASASSAISAGNALVGGVLAPLNDIDGDFRPLTAAGVPTLNPLQYDIGADEFRPGITVFPAPRRRAIAFTVRLAVSVAKLADAIPGGLAPNGHLRNVCAHGCTATLRLRGTAAARSYTMRFRNGRWRVSITGLKPGVYHYQVSIRGARGGGTLRTTWRAITVGHGRSAR